MSCTFSISCKETKKRLWIGQASREKPAGWYMYKDEETQDKIERFLIEHSGKEIKFDIDEFVDYSFDEYE